MKLTSLSVLFLLLLSFCTSKKKDAQPSITHDGTETISPERFAATSDDGDYHFSFVFTSDGMKLTNLDSKEEYDLPQARAASGTKYEDSLGHVFWSKGEEFSWIVNDSLMAQGQIKGID